MRQARLENTVGSALQAAGEAYEDNPAGARRLVAWALR
jgi:hypothetical protein